MERNRHHVLWEARSYRTPIEKKVRQLGGLIIYMNIIEHGRLHRETYPPPKLHSEEYHDLYQFMQEKDYRIGTPEGLEWANAWANDRRLYTLEENFTKQLSYMEDSYED